MFRNFPENFMSKSPKVRSPGQVKGTHLRKKVSNCVTDTVVERKFETFRIYFTTKYLQLVYLGYFFISVI